MFKIRIILASSLLKCLTNGLSLLYVSRRKNIHCMCYSKSICFLGPIVNIQLFQHELKTEQYTTLDSIVHVSMLCIKYVIPKIVAFTYSSLVEWHIIHDCLFDGAQLLVFTSGKFIFVSVMFNLIAITILWYIFYTTIIIFKHLFKIVSGHYTRVNIRHDCFFIVMPVGFTLTTIWPLVHPGEITRRRWESRKKQGVINHN